jgi:hypothetical protein
MEPTIKISCCWLYAITQYGYPVPVARFADALRKMSALGFHYVELEGASAGDNLLDVSARCRSWASPTRSSDRPGRKESFPCWL